MIQILHIVNEFLFEKWWSDQISILHMSRQLSCRDMSKIVIGSDNYLSITSNMVFLHHFDHDFTHPLQNERLCLWEGRAEFGT